MAYEPKPGDGTLWINDKKGNDNWPDRTGYVIAHRNIKAGEKLNLAGWLKGSDPKKPFLSLRMSDIRGREEDMPPSDGGVVYGDPLADAPDF